VEKSNPKKREAGLEIAMDGTVSRIIEDGRPAVSP
jgi:hypothetical protein